MHLTSSQQMSKVKKTAIEFYILYGSLSVFSLAFLFPLFGFLIFFFSNSTCVQMWLMLRKISFHLNNHSFYMYSIAEFLEV